MFAIIIIWYFTIVGLSMPSNQRSWTLPDWRPEQTINEVDFNDPSWTNNEIYLTNQVQDSGQFHIVKCAKRGCGLKLFRRNHMKHRRGHHRDVIHHGDTVCYFEVTVSKTSGGNIDFNFLFLSELKKWIGLNIHLFPFPPPFNLLLPCCSCDKNTHSFFSEFSLPVMFLSPLV